MPTPAWTSHAWPYTKGPTAERQGAAEGAAPRAAGAAEAAASAHSTNAAHRTNAAEAAQRMQRSIQGLLRSFSATG